MQSCACKEEKGVRKPSLWRRAPWFIAVRMLRFGRLSRHGARNRERRDLGWWWRGWPGLRGLGAHRFLERSSGCEDAHGQNVSR